MSYIIRINNSPSLLGDGKYICLSFFCLFTTRLSRRNRTNAEADATEVAVLRVNDTATEV